jgi:hypothetical protein
VIYRRQDSASCFAGVKEKNHGGFASPTVLYYGIYVMNVFKCT